MAGNSKRMGLGIVGAGLAASPHAQSLVELSDQIDVRGVFTRSSESRAALCAEYGFAEARTLETLLDDSAVDALLVLTPPDARQDIVERAVNAGKHLLVEKPVERSLQAARSIVDLCASGQITLGVMFQHRFRPASLALKGLIEDGKLGRLRSASLSVPWWRDQAYYDEGGWKGTQALDGGGAFMNQGIHTIDLLQWLMGPVRQVSARTATLAHEMETEDTACAVLTFKNGALGVIQGATSTWPGDQATVELRGSGGTIVLEDGRIKVWKLADAGPDEEEEMINLEAAQGSGASDPNAIGYEMHRRQVVDLVEAIRQNRPPTIQGAEARKSVEIIRAIYHSAATGQPVALPFEAEA